MKKFTTKQKYLYFSKRENNKKLSKKQRKYAKTWLDGFLYAEIHKLKDIKADDNIQRLRKNRDVDPFEKRAYFGGLNAVLYSKDKVDSVFWEYEEWEKMNLKKHERDFVNNRISKKEYIKLEEEDFLERNFYKGRPKLI